MQKTLVTIVLLIATSYAAAALACASGDGASHCAGSSTVNCDAILFPSPTSPIGEISGNADSHPDIPVVSQSEFTRVASRCSSNRGVGIVSAVDGGQGIDLQTGRLRL